MKTSKRLSQNAGSNPGSKKTVSGKKNKRYVCIKTLGCRTNQAETDNLLSGLLEKGYSVCKEIDRNTDYVVINSCMVTSRAQQKTVRQIRSAARKNPETQIIVTGCLSQRFYEKMLDFSSVRCVVGNSLKDRIPDILNDGEKGVFVSDLSKESPVDGIIPLRISSPNMSRRTRLSLKIQEGCDFRCSYCIVPHVRGPSRCVDISTIIDSVKRAEKEGYKEVILTGTHIGQYRAGGKRDLLELLKEILKETSFMRIRLSSLDMRDVNSELLGFLNSNKRVCSFCHLSVQSLSKAVLEGMNRKGIDVEEKIGMLREFKCKYPDMYLGGDFITGFPGETEAMSDETMRNIEAARFDNGHVFRFSPRQGTSAWSMKNRVPQNEIKNRSVKMRELFSDRFIKFKRANIKREGTIIVEKRNPTIGITSNYIKVKIVQSDSETGEMLKIRISGYDKNDGLCTGVLV